MPQRSDPIRIPVGRGGATGVDPSLIDPGGACQEVIGVVYEPGDPAAHKFPGRRVFNGTPTGAGQVRDVLFVDSGGAGALLAQEGATVYRSSPNTAAFSSLWTLPNSSDVMDAASLFDIGYVVSGEQSDNTSPFGAFALDGSNAYRLGLAPVLNNPGVALIAGVLTGSYFYWTTEYDSTNSVESAHSDDLSGAGMSPVGQGVRITKPATQNASADKWRIYRGVAGEKKPIGWLVAEVDIGTLTYDDNTLTDADLVLNDPYRIVSPNGIPESMDLDPQDLALSSICSFEGSLVGVTVIGGDLAYTPSQEPHSWPANYRVVFPTNYGGRSTCVRRCGDAVYGATAHELFRVNYLPDETDNVFDTDIAVEHVANYGTPSPLGMCSFTAWGGAPVLFVASLQGPILCAGKVVDRAVRNIDWENTVDLSRLLFCKAIDNPDAYRVELYFRDSADSSSWKALHFYYDGERTERREGPLPEMAWTGPHEVPGPGCYAVASAGPKKFTAGRAGIAGTVYEENIGTVDAALLVDSDGTIPFSLKTRRPYPAGIDGEVRADRLFIHCKEQSDQEYNATFTAYRENGQSKPYPNLTIQAAGPGAQSHGLNASCVSFEVTITADGVDGMAPINFIAVRIEDAQGRSIKTQVT